MKSQNSELQNEMRVFERVESELHEGMTLKKCLQCGCMKDELEETIDLPQTPETLRNSATGWLKEMEPIRYSCLGCEYCYPAVAARMLSATFPNQVQGPSCALETRSSEWPSIVGDYFVTDSTHSTPVAITTLGSSELAEIIAQAAIAGVCIVGKTETENIGIDKIIKNTITNPHLHFLLLVGSDPKGHLPGATLKALFENGIDANQRIIESPGRRPFLRNVTLDEVEIFRKQIKLIDRIGISNPEQIASIVSEVIQKMPKGTCCTPPRSQATSVGVETVLAQNPEKIEMDRAGYFVIIPDRSAKVILAEHYSYDDRLQKIIKGSDARSIYWTIINKGWISQL
ncbi:hypothetical protein L0152_20645, partial [bacterium]|nr:hypothetical protein [bacterium]